MSDDSPPWAGPPDADAPARRPRRLVESARDGGDPPSVAEQPSVVGQPPVAGPPPGAPPPGAVPPSLRPPAATGSPASTPVAPGGVGAPATLRSIGAPRPAGAQPAGFGVIIGVVNGSVSVTSELRRFWGVQALVALGLVGLILVLAGGLGQTGAAVPSALVVPFVLFAFFGLIYSVLLGIGPARYFSALRRGVARVLRGTTRVVIRGASAGARRGMGALRPAAGSGHSVTVHRFRVQSVTGEISACVLLGDLVGDEVRHGDVVRVRGRRTRHGHYQVRRIDVLSAPAGPVVAAVTARPSTAFLLALWSDRVAKALGVVAVVYLGIATW